MKLYERRLVAGGALTSTFSAMYAHVGAASLVDGVPIEPEAYMASSDVSWFDSVFSRSELIEGGLPHTISSRMFGNVVLSDHGRFRKSGDAKAHILSLAEQSNWDILATQFINENVVRHLAEGNSREFMQARAELMHSKAEALVRAPDG